MIAAVDSLARNPGPTTGIPDVPELRARDIARVRKAIADEGLRIEHVDSIASTNEALLARPFVESPAPPAALVAAQQSAGRGRRGRSWHGDPQASLMFSLSLEHLHRHRATAGMSLAAGVALAEALAPLVPDISVKWPNDLLRGERKCAGILVEVRRQGELERLVVGVGLNLLRPADAPAIEQRVGGLFDEAVPVSRNALLGALLGALLSMWDDFSVDGLARFVDRWRRFDALAGAEVAILDGERRLMEGRADGIDASGALRIVTTRGLRHAVVGEVSVRRLAREG